MRKTLTLIIFFYILVLLQTSFLVHFNIKGMVPNLVLIAVVIVNLLERPEKKCGLWVSAISGFFMDIFSGRPIGFWILILLLLAVLIKLVFKKYVRPVIRLGSRL